MKKSGSGKSVMIKCLIKARLIGGSIMVMGEQLRAQSNNIG
jgi:ABC-type polar amino acid transport system ATPase subunit